MVKKHSSPKTKDQAEMPEQPKFNWALVAVVAALAGVLLLVKSFRGKTDEFKNKTIPAAIKKVLNSPDTKFEVGTVKETSGVYEFELKLQGQTYTSYITKDGKILFTSGVKLNDTSKAAAASTTAPAKKLTEKDLKKSDQPSLTAYIVANCPYGLQMERVFKKALEEAPGMINNLKIKYIGAVSNGVLTSMHGDAEAKENLKQVCIREEQPDLFYPYLNCYMQEGKTDSCLANVGVDTTKMNACTQDATRGLAYIQKDFDAGAKFNVGGSPTLVLNDSQVVSEFDFGGRVPNSLRTILCGGSKTPADYCSNNISTNEVATAFSLTDEAASTGGTTTSAAGCAPATPAK